MQQNQVLGQCGDILKENEWFVIFAWKKEYILTLQIALIKLKAINACINSDKCTFWLIQYIRAYQFDTSY